MMERLLRSLTVALVASLLVTIASPVGAAESVSTARKKRDAVRSQRAAAAARLNALKVSDAELERAVNALGAQVKSQTSKVASARQAVTAAEHTVASAEARLAATETEIEGLTNAVVARAVSAYVRPQQAAFAEFAQAKTLGEASRRRSLLQQVASNDREVIDRLRAAREDLTIERARTQAARDVAARRRNAVEAQLGALTKSLSEKARIEMALDARIRDIQREVAALSGQESTITALIRASEERARASRGDGGVDAGGRVSGAGLIWPVRGSVTSEYGSRWGRLHAGIDISASTGTPIRAAKAGEVISASRDGGYGNMVIIDHGGGFSTVYAHQSRIATRDGQAVSQGEVIGYVGSTGNSTGPHLHFETRVGGSPQNPRRYLP